MLEGVIVCKDFTKTYKNLSSKIYKEVCTAYSFGKLLLRLGKVNNVWDFFLSWLQNDSK